MSSDTLHPADPTLFAQALVDFSENGQFPSNMELAASTLSNPALQAALSSLGKARSDLEEEVKAISRSSGPDVDEWIQNAKTLRIEMDTSRATAKSIQQSAEKGDLLRRNIKDHDAQISFLEKEQIYMQQLGAALKGIQTVHVMLNEVLEVQGDNRILDALHKLGAAASEKRLIPALPSGRPLIMLEERYVKVQGDLHEQFQEQWKALVNVDIEGHSVQINFKTPDGGLDLDHVFAAMEGFKDTEKLMKDLADELKQAIFEPRFKLTKGALPLFRFDRDSVRLEGSHNNCEINHIITDLEKLITFLSSKLPGKLLHQLSITCATCISDHMKMTWLDVAVPARLGDEMTEFRRTMGMILHLAETMDNLNWVGSKEFREWVEGCAKIWLVKRKEYSLDWVRNRLAFGIGACRKVEKVEKEVVQQDETADAQDWDSNWDDDENKNNEEEGDEWGGDAWGFGDDVANVPFEISQSPPKESAIQTQVDNTEKIVTLTEKYTISSMPSSVFDTILAIIEDAITLSDPANETNPITPAAAGLFAVPTLVLAMYRAVAPYHYKSHSTGGGRMFQYNDSMWLSSSLENVIEDWKKRPNISPRAHGKIKFDAEIETLKRWGERAYTEELIEQKTILKDLMGGTHSFLDADSRESINVSGGWGFDDNTEESKEGELEKMIDNVVNKIRTVTTTWKKILSKSAWVQASAALLSIVAQKIVTDIQDRDSLGSDECERIANLIDQVLKLDDLFVPMNLDAEDSLLESHPTSAIKPIPFASNAILTSKTSSDSSSVTRASDITAEKISQFDSDISFPSPDESYTLGKSIAFVENANLTEAQKRELIHEKIKSGEIVPLTMSYVGTNWTRLHYARELLMSRLDEIEWLWRNSDLSLDYDAEEVVGWVERCFVGSKRRREVVSVIRSVRGRKR